MCYTQNLYSLHEYLFSVIHQKHAIFYVPINFENLQQFSPKCFSSEIFSVRMNLEIYELRDFMNFLSSCILYIKRSNNHSYVNSFYKTFETSYLRKYCLFHKYQFFVIGSKRRHILCYMFLFFYFMKTIRKIYLSQFFFFASCSNRPFFHIRKAKIFYICFSFIFH